jgi:OmpA-OmpF porin, OOP family
MAESYFASFSNLFPSTAVQSIASQTGSSERTILGGVQSAIAAVVNGLTQKSGDKGFMGQVTQLASSTPENAVSSAVSHDALTNPNSSDLSGGNQLLSGVFGGRLSSIIDSISKQTGLRAGAASSLLALAGTTVLGLLGKKVRDGSLSASNLPAFLQRESGSLQEAVPSGYTPSVPTGNIPTAVSTRLPERRRPVWLWPLLLLLAIFLLGYWWVHSRARRVAVNAPTVSAPNPTVPKIMSSTGVDLGPMIDVKVCDGSTMRVPERGVENKLISFVRNPGNRPDQAAWLDFDRLLFDTNSATLQAQSVDQLRSLSTILKACPGVHLTIGGYTDNTGDPAHNRQLSQDRANTVVTQLEGMGVARDRLVARGYGDQHPVADNSTPEGRQMNRRISMLVTNM